MVEISHPPWQLLKGEVWITGSSLQLVLISPVRALEGCMIREGGSFECMKNVEEEEVSVLFIQFLVIQPYAGKDENGLGWGSYRDWSWVFWCDQLAFKGQAVLYSRKSTLFYETWPFSKKLKTINTCVVWMLHFRLCAWSSSDKCNVNWGSLVREHRWFFKKHSLKQEGKFPVWALTMSIVILYFSMALRTADHCQSECSLLLTAVP